MYPCAKLGLHITTLVKDRAIANNFYDIAVFIRGAHGVVYGFIMMK
ncbi:hypothetical protein IIU_06956 [Bacillus cereus VD133]|uniref:Uncharacterized protein n=1 Tax=Bacillus cereus VD133 TaxID=1053233 RepID=A0A9W5PJ99_BACCE|nr:hypothetical protein IIU_06956 [Bacillus cereus VD133]